MVAKAKAMYVRVSTRKSREVAALVRGKQVEDALKILKFTPRKPAAYIAKVIRSAMANAEENSNIRDLSGVKVGEILVEMGPPMKRFTPRAHGRASLIRKPTTHFKVLLEYIREVK
ncbi:MAG: 50S ribosomal protein L22 [Deferribacteraceae bacterium]|jgi:large subunit ribosomal protein L22|nr:50S ribosomal protein L22 [Deferribacteraceae bacterium]